MGGFLRTLWWIVLFLYLFCAVIWGMKRLENRCYCEEELRLIDCSRAKLKAIPKSVLLVNYTTLNLRYNLLVQANFCVGATTSQFKNGGPEGQPVRLQRIPGQNDFRSRRCLWKSLKRRRWPEQLKAKSRKPTNILSSQDLDPGTSIIIYMTALISTFALMPVLIVCLRVVGKMFKLKRTRTPPISRELSLFNFDVDSEEHVVFENTQRISCVIAPKSKEKYINFYRSFKIQVCWCYSWD